MQKPRMRSELHGPQVDVDSTSEPQHNVRESSVRRQGGIRDVTPPALSFRRTSGDFPGVDLLLWDLAKAGVPRGARRRYPADLRRGPTSGRALPPAAGGRHRRRGAQDAGDTLLLDVTLGRGGERTRDESVCSFPRKY